MRAPWSDGWASAITVAAAVLALVGLLGGGVLSYAALGIAAALTALIVRREDAADRITITTRAAQESPDAAPLTGVECLVGQR